MIQSSIARQKLASYPPDFVMEVPRNACDMLDFHKASQMIEMGHRKAAKCIEQIRAHHAA